MSDAVDRCLEAVLRERDRLTDHDHLTQRRVLELEVPAPGDRHEDVRNRQQRNGMHPFPFLALFSSSNGTIGSQGSISCYRKESGSNHLKTPSAPSTRTGSRGYLSRGRRMFRYAEGRLLKSAASDRKYVL